MPKPNIAIITGTRAEYGIWEPVLRALQESKKLRPQLVVTGMHLQNQFGATVRIIEATSPVGIAAKVRMYQGNESPADSFARATAALAKTFRNLKPDLVMVLGDRLEILAAASAALAERIPLAHVHGGETAPGIWDEQIRHAVTKMAHLHFCATRTARQRILQMGEDPRSVHVVGAPALDWAVHEAKLNQRLHARKAGHYDPLLLLHPSSSDEALEYRRAKMLIKLIRDQFPSTSPSGKLTVIGPNNDPGHRGILRACNERNDIKLQMSFSQNGFWISLHMHGLLIGNSSAGIIEAASFGCPAINIGDRQKGRERSPNVLDVPWNESAIRRALHKATKDLAFRRSIAKRKNVYGDGHASAQIFKILESLKFPIPTTKRFHSPTSS